MSPALFQQVLQYYIGVLKKPVAIDYRPDRAVDNHIISRYSLRSKRIGPNTLAVSARLVVHKYDSSITDETGPAADYRRYYSYELNLDEGGKVVSSRWTSKSNPDFLWVPLASASCRRNNQRLQKKWVEEILGL